MFTVFFCVPNLLLFNVQLITVHLYEKETLEIIYRFTSIFQIAEINILNTACFAINCLFTINLSKLYYNRLLIRTVL